MKCIVLAGGSGDRLWPLSRKNYPKQFMNVKDNRSLFQETIARNIPFCDEFYIITSEKYQYIVEGQLQVFQGLKYRCFLEEVGRKTAPAVAFACFLANTSESFLVVSTDHIIDGGNYKESILTAKELVREGYIVSLGVKPHTFESGYGYIKTSENNVTEIIESSAEFMSAAKSRDFEGWLYDTGILLMGAGDYLHELKKYSPEVYKLVRKAAANLDISRKNILINREYMEEIPSVSIGKAVTEKSDKVKVLECDFNWSRIMSLEAFDQYNNGKDIGNCIQESCDNVTLINYSKQRLVVANDVKDVMVVSTSDAVYVSKKNETATIKDIIKDNYEEQKRYFDEGDIYYTSWGIKETLTHEPGYKVKKITVFPGKTISAHMHTQKSEHWSVVNGVATIMLENDTREYKKNESIYVPVGAVHQISNRTTEDLEIIEVSIGNEEDIPAVSHGENFTLAINNIMKLEPAFKDYLWGGTRLRDLYGKKCDYDKIAESWELSTHKAGQSIIATGRYKGMMLGEFISSNDASILGWKCEHFEQFPLLIKFIDARESLSIQVHPDDEYALREENEYGKNEMWYIVDCEPDAYLYCGFKKDISKEEVRRRIEDCTLEEVLNKVPVHKGQTIFIKAGTIHAIGKGILICEIQQSSNVTYRLYDYGRRDKYGELRELHIDKGLDVLDTTVLSYELEDDIVKSEVASAAENNAVLLGECKYFSVAKYDIEEKETLLVDESSFEAVVVISGEGKIVSGEDELTFGTADTFFIPAGKKKVEISGKCVILVVRI